MAAPASTDEFLDLVRKSGVLDEKRLDSYLTQLRAQTTLPPDPNKLAGILVRDGILTHFQAEQFLLGKWRRFTIGKYKVLERLGSGGMGSVYLCEHKFMRRRVAVKVLPAAKAEDPSSLERFYREARAAAALDHPNIVRAYDIDQDENLHFLVMEYVDGASLQEIVKRHGPLHYLFASHYVRQAAIGLQHAHEAGLVHRDIKPGNLLVDRAGTLKVLDMGLARFFHDEEDILTKKYDESVLGTADYLAPEQALDSHGVDIRADIYSLGATFYFCLTGNPPFNEGTVAQKLIWHQTRQPKPVRAIRQDVPEGLAAIVDKMMIKDRTKRYQTPAQIVEALAAWTTKPIQQPPDAWMPRLSPAAMGSVSESGSANTTPAPPALQSQAPRAPQATPAPNRGSSPVMAPPRSIPQPPRPVPAPQPQRAATPQPLQRQPGNNGAFAQAGASHHGDEQPPDWGQVTSGPAPPSRPAIPRPSSATVKPPSVRRPPPAPSQGKKKVQAILSTLQSMLQSMRKRPKLMIVFGGLVALVLILLVFLVARGMFGKPKPTQRADSGRRLTVSLSKERGEYPSVARALTSSIPGDHVVVMDEVIEEVLDLTALRKPIKDVTLEGDSSLGKRVVWRPPPPAREGQQSSQLLTLSNCDGLLLKGFHFQGQNGSHQILDLLYIFGKCPGLKLEDLVLEGFKRSAIKMGNSEGDSTRPVTFSGLHTRAPVGDKASALAFDVQANSVLAAIKHVRVEDCLFEGPYESAVQMVIADGRELGEVEFQRNRFFKAVDGFFFKRPKEKPAVLQLKLESNTFCEIQRGLHFEIMPAEDRSQVLLKNDLFCKVPVLAHVDDYPQPSAKVFPADTDSVADDGSKPENVQLNVTVMALEGLNTDPAAEQQFLRYPKTSPLNTAGINGGPVGAPPQD